MTFNDLLAERGIDPRRVQLARHAGGGAPPRTPFSVWRDSREAFDHYNAVQSPRRGRPKFDVGGYVAAFVATKQGETLFTGLYLVEKVEDVEQVRPGDICPVNQRRHDPGSQFFTMHRVDAFEDLVDRLTIDWGSGYRSWIQRADRQPKMISPDGARR